MSFNENCDRQIRSSKSAKSILNSASPGFKFTDDDKLGIRVLACTNAQSAWLDVSNPVMKAIIHNYQTDSYHLIYENGAKEDVDFIQELLRLKKLQVPVNPICLEKQ